MYKNNEKLLNLTLLESLKDNAMLKHSPHLFKEWDFEKNNELGLDVYEITKGSNKHVFWECKNKHKWSSKVCNRTMGRKCPYCSNQKVWIGYNDIWSTNPELASLLVNPEDGYKYTYGSFKKVDWKCPDCDEIIKNKTFNYIKNNRLRCPKCGTGKSFPERVVYYTLKSLYIDFEHERTFTWSQGKRYDFYIPSYNMVIEVHGAQHYPDSQAIPDWRTPEDEFNNDYMKQETALINGMKYVVIDAKKSDFNYIKNNIISSLKEIIDMKCVDWSNINKLSSSSLLIKVCKAWEKGGYRIFDLAKEFKLSNKTITTYLNKGNEIGVCNYDSKEHNLNRVKNNKKKVVQLKNNEVIKVWNSINEASQHYEIKGTCISACCNGKRLSAVGYNWLFLEHYEKSISSDGTISLMKDCRTKKVAQFTTEEKFIRIWNSIAEATNSLGYKGNRSSISGCCKGLYKTAFGFKWKYVE